MTMSGGVPRQRRTEAGITRISNLTSTINAKDETENSSVVQADFPQERRYSHNDLEELTHYVSGLEIEENLRQQQNLATPFSEYDIRDILSSTGAKPEIVEEALRRYNSKLEEKSKQDVEKIVTAREKSTLDIMYDLMYDQVKDMGLEILNGAFKIAEWSFLLTHAIPTAFLKSMEYSFTYDKKHPEDADTSAIFPIGAFCGAFLGCLGNCLLYARDTDHLSDAKYLLIPLATNIASGLYECYRHAKNKSKDGGKKLC